MDDEQVRLAAFRFLEEQMQLATEGGALPRRVLTEGFTYEGQRVPLMGPQGIFKPRILREIPLSITTVPIIEGATRPTMMLLAMTAFCAIAIEARTQVITRTSAFASPCRGKCRSSTFMAWFQDSTSQNGPSTLLAMTPPS